MHRSSFSSRQVPLVLAFRIGAHVFSPVVSCRAMPSSFSHVQLFATLRTVAHQAPLSMGFSRQEYWSGLPCPPPGDLPDPGIETVSLPSPALAGRLFTTSTTQEAYQYPNPRLSPQRPLAHAWGTLLAGLLPLWIWRFQSRDQVLPPNTIQNRRGFWKELEA